MDPPAQLDVLAVVLVALITQLPFTHVMPGTVPGHPPALVVGSVPVG
jgi:hypothetical protein